MKSPFEAYGVECGKGWKGLYEPLIALCNLYGVKVMQVKEKFGTLRFYTDGVRPEVDTLIDAACVYSKHMCEDCGESGWLWGADFQARAPKATCGPSRTSSWLRTLCAPCRETMDTAREAKKAERSPLETQ